MARFRLPQLTILGRIVLFLAAFFTVLMLQLGISHYQSKYIMEPLDQRTENIQTISQFLGDVEGCMTALEKHRWDLGDAASLVVTIREYREASQPHLDNISSDLPEVSEAQYLLANAARTTYNTLNTTLDQIIDLLLAGDRAGASALYYDKAEPCGGYLMQYTRQLLEQAIYDNQGAYTALSTRSDRLEQVQNLMILLCVVLGVIVLVSLVRVLRSVVQMARASQAISRGEFDIPDMDESMSDEIGHMAHAFNEMKRSMKQQVELLQEKHEMERRLRKTETEALELQNLMEREKLQQLRSQINPHFLFNTLNVISYNAQQEGAPRTQALIGSLSRLFRYTLQSNETRVPLSREVHIVDEFYTLYHVRFGDRIRLSWEIAPEVELTETLVPSFILQPLVENSFKHGILPREEGGCVVISMHIEDGLLNIAVADDGVGMNDETLDALRRNLRNPPTTGEHIGMYNVAARLRLFGRNYGMGVRSREGEGTVTTLWMPLVIQEEEEEADD